MYLCLRLLPMSTRSADCNPHSPKQITPLAAFAGALAFEFSDLFIVHFGNLNMIAVAAWLPLIFLPFPSQPRPVKFRVSGCQRRNGVGDCHASRSYPNYTIYLC